MILTITMNPSVDISYHIPSFKMDTVNRVTETHKTAGGKGLNVTRVLSQLGDDVIASGLIGGQLGDFIEEELNRHNISHAFYKISGATRNCIAVLHEGQQTEILEKGPEISTQEAQGFLTHLKDVLPSIDLVTISGSLPQGLAADYYTKIIDSCQSRGIPVVLDCSGEALRKSLEYSMKPTVIKPNTEELAQLLGYSVSMDTDDLKRALSEPLFEKVEWVIVSLGAHGAFARHGHDFYRVNIPKIDVVNPVGSGDSTVAGIASSLVQDLTDEKLLKKANVLGMLNAQEKLTGRVNLAHYDELIRQITVEKV